MKRLALIVCGFLMVMLLSCETELSKHEKISEQLLRQAKESELKALYDEMVDYLDKDENYTFNKEKNLYSLEFKSAQHVMMSLYDFHMKNHVPLLQDKEHPENWDNWFYFYNLLVNYDGSVPLDKLDRCDEFTTVCDYCRLSYKEGKDIVWSTIPTETINDFSKIKDAAIDNVNRLTLAKEKADAEEAERKRIEESMFKGVWGCNFGMTVDEVKAVMKKKGIVLNNEGDWTSSTDEIGSLKNNTMLSGAPNSKITYAGIPIDGISIYFIENQLYRIALSFETSFEAEKAEKTSAYIAEKYQFDKNFKTKEGSNYFFNWISKTYLKKNLEFIFTKNYTSIYRSAFCIFEFSDTEILDKAIIKVQEKEKADWNNRNDF